MAFAFEQLRACSEIVEVALGALRLGLHPAPLGKRGVLRESSAIATAAALAPSACFRPACRSFLNRLLRVCGGCAVNGDLAAVEACEATHGSIELTKLKRADVVRYIDHRIAEGAARTTIQEPGGDSWRKWRSWRIRAREPPDERSGRFQGDAAAFSGFGE